MGELDDLQNTVIDAMSQLIDHEQFDPLHYHSLVHSVHKELLLVEDSMSGKKVANHDDDFDECMEDPHQVKADIFIHKIEKQKKKNQGKGGRKPSKNLPNKDSPSTSDD